MAKKTKEVEEAKELSVEQIETIKKTYRSDVDECNDDSALYDKWRISIKLRGRITGGIPKSEALFEDWIKARTKFNDSVTKQQVAEMRELYKQTKTVSAEATDLVDKAVEEKEEKSWVGFLADEQGLYLEARCVKAMFKECASLRDFFVKKKGTKQVMQHGTFLIRGLEGKADRVHLGRMTPDGTEERPIHVDGPQGPRTALKKVDYCVGCEMQFEVWIMKIPPQAIKHIGKADLISLLQLARNNGIGSDRSQGSGEFDVTAFEKSLWDFAEIEKKVDIEDKKPD